MKRIITLFSMAIFVSLPGLALAQWSVGPHLVISIPNSDFANVSDVGGGFGLKGIYDLSGPFSLRGDFAFISHGREFTSISFGATALPAQVKKDSYRLTAGPMLSTRGRHFRLHVEAAGGFYIFRTSLNDNFGRQFTADTDAALGWNAGGGVQYDIGLGPWLDVSFEYQTIYNVTTEFEDELGQKFKENIDANELTIKVGVIFFLN